MPKRLSVTTDFPALVAPGENPNGVRVESVEGVMHGGIGTDYFKQWNWGPGLAGPRWDAEQPPLGDGLFGPNASNPNPGKMKAGR
jgi:hypothetical protein